jgi:hypothetical protein
MKKWINIDISLLKTLLDEQAIAGLGVISQLSKQEYQEEFMPVQNVKKKRQTKKKNLTISTQSYPSILASVAGTCTRKDCFQAQLGGKCCVQNVMMKKPNENEPSELKLGVGTKHDLPEDKGTKYDAGKPALAYIPKAALYAEGEAFAYGAKKYGSWNYKNGIHITRTLSASLRHIVQFLGGETIDPESGVNHLGCARANLAMALDTLENHPELDDRFKGDKK